MAPRVLVTGASGLLGRAVLAELSTLQRWEVLGTAYSRASESLRKVDLTSQAEVSALVRDFQPRYIVHSAAERRPDVVDKQEDATKALNVASTEYICQAANAIDATVVFISTDYVFDGRSPPYGPASMPNPLNKYGHSKLAGERIVMEANSNNMVLRVPILYGAVEFVEESAVTILLKSLLAPAPVSVNHHERRYPTYTCDVAKVLSRLLALREADPLTTGHFHWSGDQCMTKYDMTVAIATAFNLPADHITPDKSASGGALRPYDARLDCSRLEALGVGERTPFDVAIRDSLQRFVSKP